MAGIYIHIPFCRKACHYCDFHFSTSLQQMQAITEALLIELKIRQQYIQEPVETIYFGGGTPSLLSKESPEKIINATYKYYPIANDVELTLEANPDDVNNGKLKDWIQLGINRLSIGVQSFTDSELQWMNRTHTAQQSITCIQQAQQKGFENISIDLIYGTPALTDDAWIETLQTAASLHIPHLSCYALTVEEKTALHYMMQKQHTKPVDADTQAKQFIQLSNFLIAQGYEHYEISNLAKSGWRSKHNTAYWQKTAYLGIGPSAHSFNGTSRQWNVAHNALYIQAIQQQQIPYTIEQLTPIQQLNEYIMTGLRMQEGISFKYINHQWGGKYATILQKNISTLLNPIWINSTANSLQLTLLGKLMADGIAAMLFFD